MNLTNLLATSRNSSTNHVDDYFNTTLYNGNGSGSQQTIITNINVNPIADPDWQYVAFLSDFNGTPINKATGLSIPNTLAGTSGAQRGKFNRGLVSARTLVGTNSKVSNINLTGLAYNSPWCIEGWARAEILADGNNAVATLFENNTSSSMIRVDVVSNTYPDSAQVNVIVQSDIGGFVSLGALVTTSSLHFISVNWDGATVYLHVDGILKQSGPFNGFGVFPTGTTIGCAVDVVVAAGTTAILDDVRWTFGSARSTTRTIVPTFPFPATSVAGSSGLLLIKNNDGTDPFYCIDSHRAESGMMATNVNAADVGNNPSIGGFVENGFQVGLGNYNNLDNKYSAFTFRTCSQFFDIVKYTGTGSTTTISHNLRSLVGFMLVKRIDSTGDWMAYYNGMAITKYMSWTSASAGFTDSTVWGGTAPTTTGFTVGSHSGTNAAGGIYVAYLFAHNPNSDGNIQCGTFTTNGSGQATINLGWEPQFLMCKATTVAENWMIEDTMRNWSATLTSVISPNSTNAAVGTIFTNPTSTGFSVNGATVSATYMYVAIRRSTKVPTTGSQVLSIVNRTGTGAATEVTSFSLAPDLLIETDRTKNAGNHVAWFDRLRGKWQLLSSNQSAEADVTSAGFNKFLSNGYVVNGNDGTINNSMGTYINYAFKRATNFLDIIIRIGSNSVITIPHKLKATPGLIITKNRTTNTTNWIVSSSVLGTSEYLVLNSNAAVSTAAFGWNQYNNASTYTVGSSGNTNALGSNYVDYLFATLAKVSKIGMYTGNGTSQTINCDFTTGARFVLIKSISDVGDWYIWDTVRGITATSDPHLTINSIASEVTTSDSIDPIASGFIVNQTTTAINTNAVTYLYMAIS